MMPTGDEADAPADAPAVRPQHGKGSEAHGSYQRRNGLEPKVIHALVAFFSYRQNKAQPQWNHLKSAMDQLYRSRSNITAEVDKRIK